ncbi:protein translocase subunit SecD [Prauserella alba]|uniref:Protein translocase subunit SecD n=1 Tax=Prauserella alba TaxID=176898 RepID=A0ABN1VHT2_9PSEU|nr:protein translocase subunit SecD [Prauserella alba]MCP2183432.1 preprotein translocase subunit SecD [Prauserella alba]
MAPPAGTIRPGRYLSIFVLIIVALYSLVFLTGDREPTPKLGIDLQGGTRVTLTARTPDGQEPSQDQLDQARQIIETRVNGIGVSGAEVVLDGSNVVITVPGEEGEQAKNLGRTAKLGFRTVINAQPVQQQGQQGQNGQQGQQGQGDGGQQDGGQQNGQDSPDAAGSPQGGGGSQPQSDEDVAREIREAKQVRQNPALDPGRNPQQGASQQAMQLQQQAMASLTCSGNDPLVGNDDPNRPLVTCNEAGTEKYVLSPVFLQGTQVDDASAQFNPQQGGWLVNLQFKGEGTETWAEYTAQNTGANAAFVLDTRVVSAPTINEPIPNGRTQISGEFTEEEAQNLADILKYGSLPLSFESSDATTVSPTLGLASLEAGLIAGAIGIALVFVYCLIYYRMLGVLTVLSLALSAMIVYAVLVLLGRWIGFTLDLAGVAGFIIAIGVTADSFVVYFERIKDEMRDAKTFRSAVPRAWVRARRTILASDAIMFLCAGVLYALAVGEVRGFAFTLGMSTVLDLIVVFLVTHPLVAMVSRSKKLSSPKLSGLGTVQRLGSQRRGGVHISQTKAATNTKGA